MSFFEIGAPASSSRAIRSRKRNSSHSGRSSPKGILEIGTGRIDRIYVLVPDNSGRFQVAVGGVYSYYEFTTPPGERLTDEAWRGLLDAGKAPARPAWEEAFLVR